MPDINTIENNSLEKLGNDLPLGAKFINPEKIIGEMGVVAGMAIADFGCGTGYFSLPLAKIVGEKGVIYSLDILKSKLEAVKSQAKLSGLNNIKVQRANLEIAEGSKLEKESMDWVVLVNMLFQNNKEGRGKIINEARRVLKKGGRMLVIEWNNNESPIGPDKSLRVSEDELLRVGREHGLGIVKELKIGDFHHGLILAK
jgi:ubiquinone/menaquinone biosynthesis C-methylase UbiE